MKATVERLGLVTLNCEHCEKIVKNQEDFEEGGEQFQSMWRASCFGPHFL